MIRELLLTRERRDGIAMVEGERIVTFPELTKKALSVRGQLKQERREHVAIFLPDGSDYAAALFGIYMAGMTAFPLNYQLTRHEIVPLLKQVRVSVVVTSVVYRELFEEVRELTGNPGIIYIEEAILTDELQEPPVCQVSEDEPLLLLTTSGTTGKAKIVQLSERNFRHSVLAYIDKMDFAKYPADNIRYILGTPLFAVYGLLILTACLVKAFPVIIMKETFTLDLFYKTVAKHQVTHYEGGVSVGLLMEQMAGRPVSYDLKSLGYLGLAGSKVTADTLAALTDAYPGVDFWPGYGMTEASPLIAKPYKSISRDKLGAVGTVIMGMDIKIEVNGSLTDEPYLRGEVAARGPNVMLGYYENDEETQQIIREGYLYTGDIGYLDEDGYLYICGRKKNVIMSRGFSVYAEEVEACLLNSGLTQDCLVYGDSDRFGNEIVCADIVPATPQVGPDQIHTYCREYLTGYKQPQRIRLVDNIRKTATGKVERG